MSELTKKSSMLQDSYSYQNESVTGTVIVSTNTLSAEITNINGSLYHLTDGAQGAYIGNFTGQLRNGEMKYSMSEMTREDSQLVWEAIDDIQAKLAE